jgi:dephospho-CoA kinase
VPVVGLIGGIGSGKSQVASLLSEQGAVVVDADSVGHQVLEEPRIRQRLRDRFGPGILRDPGTMPAEPPRVDRRKLASLVFQDAEALRDLESIVHPEMRRRFEEAIDRESRRGTARLIVLDAAILLEAGWNDLCDLVVFVDSPRAVRLERVARSRGWDEPTLSAREAAQWDLERKRALADLTLKNAGDLAELRLEVDRLLEVIGSPRESASESPAAARCGAVPWRANQAASSTGRPSAEPPR